MSYSREAMRLPSPLDLEDPVLDEVIYCTTNSTLHNWDFNLYEVESWTAYLIQGDVPVGFESIELFKEHVKSKLGPDTYERLKRKIQKEQSLLAGAKVLNRINGRNLGKS